MSVLATSLIANIMRNSATPNLNCLRRKKMRNKEDVYCNQCGFVGDEEDFREHNEELIKEGGCGHTGYKGDKLIR